MEPNNGDVVAQLERRNRRARLGLTVGAVCLIVGLLGGWTSGSGSAGTLLSALNILALFIGPPAFSVAAANFTTSDSAAVRLGYAVLAGILSLVLLLFLLVSAYFSGGGRIAM